MNEIGQAGGTGDPALEALLATFDTIVQDLAGYDLTTLVRLHGPSSGLLAAGVRVERARRALALFDHHYVSALEEGGEPARHGVPNTATFLKLQLRLSPSQAKRRVAAAHACTPTIALTGQRLETAAPVLALAQGAGALSGEHTAVILGVLDRLPDRLQPELRTQVEGRLVAQALTSEPGVVARAGRILSDQVDPDATLRDTAWQERTRAASLRVNADGTGDLHARLTAETLEILQTVLDPLARPHPTGPDGPDPRTPAQRTHDALRDAFQRLLHAGDLPACGGTPTTIVIHTTTQHTQTHTETGASGLSGGEFGCGLSGSGLARTDHGTTLPLPTALRLADQTDIYHLTTTDNSADAKGQPTGELTAVPLALGRTRRIATPAQTIALAARDRGCTFPGCDRPPAWTQRHHITPWHQGGSTDLNNLTLICGYHHRVHEARGWTCQMINGQPWWTPPAWIDPTQTPIRNTTHDPPELINTG